MWFVVGSGGFWTKPIGSQIRYYNSSSGKDKNNGEMCKLWKDDNVWPQCTVVEEIHPPEIQTEFAKSLGV